METTADPGNGFSQQCSSCDSSSLARCWCLDCNEALCDVCLSAHRRVTVTRSHRILNQPPAGAVSTPPTKFCRLHPSEPLKLFCFTCSQLTCRDCQLMAHMSHRYQFVHEALDSLKKQLEVWIQPIRAHRVTARQSLLDMKTRLQHIVESESHLRTELQQSYNVLVQLLKKRMDDILKETKMVCKLECERIQRRTMELNQLQQNQQSVTETAEKAQNTSDLSALLTYSAQIESQLKDLHEQDLSPPQTMSELNVITDRKSLETFLNFGELKVSWIPFSVSQTSSQNRDTPAASSSSSSHLTTTCPAPSCRLLPQTITTGGTDSPTPPVPVTCSATAKSSSSQFCSSPSSSSLSCSTSASFTSSSSSYLSATPPAATCLAPSCGTLPQSRKTCGTDSPVPVNCPSTSWKSSFGQSSVNQSGPPRATSTAVTSTQTVKHPSSSDVKTVTHLGTNTRQVLVLMNHVQPVSTAAKLQPVSFGFPLSAAASPSCTVLKVVQPSLVLNRPTAPHQKQPAVVLLTNSQTVDQVSSVIPMLLSQTASSTLTNQQPLKDKSCPPSSLARPTSDISPWSSSHHHHQQQSPVVRAVADSACDRSLQQVIARRQEPAENEPTSTVSEETEPAGETSEPEVSDRNTEGPSSGIGHPDCSLSQWQPRVSLVRLPVSPPRPGCPLPAFRLVPGDDEDEIYLEELSEVAQSHADDITEPPSLPESPVTLQIVTCSACGSAYGSIVCVACGRGYHRDCHVPPVGPDIWSEWICSLCQDLSDPSDPYSSDRPPRPESPCLSLLDQRRCESLLLYLKVEGCSRLSESAAVWSPLKLVSERLTLRRPPSYQRAAEFLSDVWSLFKDASQNDDVLNKLQENFQSRLMETFSSELHASVLMPPSSSRNSVGGSKVTSEEQEVVTSKSKMTEMRKRLGEFLDLAGTSRSKRTKMEQ